MDGEGFSIGCSRWRADARAGDGGVDVDGGGVVWCQNTAEVQMSLRAQLEEDGGGPFSADDNGFSPWYHP